MNNTYTFWGITLKTIVTHTVTYFLMGILAFFLFDYATQYTETSLNLLMRPTTDPIVRAGILFQPIRGLLFGIAFYLLREVFFDKKLGWLMMWVVLIIMGILSTFGPAPASIEGMVYTTLPFSSHFGWGLVEIYSQALLLSFVTYYWVNHPEKKWLTWVLIAAFCVVLLLPILALLAS